MFDLSNLKYVTSKNLYIVAVTKTWVKHDETKSTIADISPPGYSFFSRTSRRSASRRRCKHTKSDYLKTNIHPLPLFKTFEVISARIGNNSFSGFVVCLYRLQNGTCQFLDEFQDLLKKHNFTARQFVYIGRFPLTSRKLKWKHQQIQ